MHIRTCVVFALTQFAVFSAAHAQTDTSHLVTVSLLVRNDYDDSAESLNTVRKFLSLGLFERLDQAPKKLVVAIKPVFRRYWFGSSELPKDLPSH